MKKVVSPLILSTGTFPKPAIVIESNVSWGWSSNQYSKEDKTPLPPLATVTQVVSKLYFPASNGGGLVDAIPSIFEIVKVGFTTSKNTEV